MASACLLACGTTAARLEAARQLDALSPAWALPHAKNFQQILAHALAADAYVCEPAPQRVFFGEVLPGTRTIHGSMPHYDLYHGPMRYQVRREPAGWRVSALVLVQAPPADERMELPDCELSPQLEGRVECVGQPFTRSETLAICPDIGRFSAPATAHNVRVLLGHWSREVERYYNRDARSQGLPIRYDFEFALAGASPGHGRASLVVPLATSCARTPYFHAMRSGWSVPILAHEMGHVLGLLDEYEMFSGIVSFYPKTPFDGAERSRMGLSMREQTVVLPLHHYLVLRRYFCPEPERDPFRVRF